MQVGGHYHYNIICRPQTHSSPALDPRRHFPCEIVTNCSICRVSALSGQGRRHNGDNGPVKWVPKSMLSRGGKVIFNNGLIYD